MAHVSHLESSQGQNLNNSILTILTISLLSLLKDNCYYDAPGMQQYMYMMSHKLWVLINFWTNILRNLYQLCSSMQSTLKLIWKFESFIDMIKTKGPKVNVRMLLLIIIHSHLQYKGICSLFFFSFFVLVFLFIDKVWHGHSYPWDATSMTIRELP